MRQHKLLENGAAIGQHYFISAYVKLVPTEAYPEPRGQKFQISFGYKYSDGKLIDFIHHGCSKNICTDMNCKATTCYD